MPTSSSGPVKNPGVDAYYNQQLGLNVQNYQNILNAYAGAQANASTALTGIYGDFGQLGKNTNDLMRSAYDVGSKDIQAGATRTLGKIKGNAVSSGLGNSTVQMALQNQAQALTGREYGRLTNDVSQQAADRQTQIGLAGLQSRLAGLGMQNNMAQSYMGNLAGFRFNPGVDLYGQQSYSSSPDGGGGGGGRGGYGGGAPSNYSSGLSPGMQGVWDARYGKADKMGYSGAYTYPTYGGGPAAVDMGQSMSMGGDWLGDGLIF